MTLQNKPNNYDKEVRQESYTDGNGNIYQTKETTEIERNGNPDSYSHGYLHGQAVERSQRRRLIQRDEDNTSRGLLLGALIATIAILAGGFIWYFSQRDNYDSDPVTPIIIPNSEQPQESPSPSPTIEPQTRQESKSETTIIEKVREVPIPVPVPNQEPAQPQNSQPAVPQQQPVQPKTEININNPVTPDNSKAENKASEPAPQSQTDANTTDTNTTDTNKPENTAQ